MSRRQWLQRLAICLSSLLQLSLASNKCVGDHACYVAVASGNGNSTLAQSSCQSYFSYTVSPCHTTTTATRKFFTEGPVPTHTVLKTSYRFTNDPVATTLDSLLYIATTLDIERPTETYDVYQTVYTPTTVFVTQTVTSTTTTYLPGQQQETSSALMQRDPVRNAASQVTTCQPRTIRPSHTPVYLKTACKNPSAYSLACSCLGVSQSTTILPQKTSTTIIRRTYTITPPFTATVTSTTTKTITFHNTVVDYTYTNTITTTAHEVIPTFLPITLTKTLPSTITSTVTSTVYTATVCSTIELYGTGGQYPGAYLEIELGTDETYLDDVVDSGPALTLQPQPDGTFYLFHADMYNPDSGTYAGAIHDSSFDYFRFDYPGGPSTPLECSIAQDSTVTCGFPGAVEYTFYTCEVAYPIVYVAVPDSSQLQPGDCTPFKMVAGAAC